MPVPLIAAAGKFLAKQATKKAVGAVAGKVTNKGGGGSGNKATKPIAIMLVVLTVYFVAAIGYGFFMGITAMIVPTHEYTCVGTGGKGNSPGNAGNEDDSLPVGEGHVDGSGGSNEPFPSESSEKLFYPVPNGVNSISSSVGMRLTPPGSQDFFGTGSYYHNGTDFAVPMGTPVFAMADGIVAQAGSSSIGYGNVVTLHHLINGKKYSTTYGHMVTGSITVSVGDTVKGGQRIASVGSEGNSTGAHLHWVLTDGIYSTNYSEYNKGPQNNIDGAAFLASNGASSTTDENIDGTPMDPTMPNGPADACAATDATQDGTIKPWGGHKNGEIPDSELVSLSWEPTLRLMKEAAGQLEDLNANYKERFGFNLPVKSAYLSVDAQGVRDGEGSAVAGWAKSVELDPFIVKFGSEEYKWLMANGPKVDWMNPSINGQNGASPKAERWVYVGGQVEGDVQLPENLTEYQQYAGRKLVERGFSDSSELACLVQIWNKESNWNPNAANPTSSARGIPQMMMNIHFGADWETNAAGREYLTNPSKQIDVGLDYIQGRYSSPCNAWNIWQTQSWY